MLIYFALFPIIGLFYVLFLNRQINSRPLFFLSAFGFLGLVAALRTSDIGVDVKLYEDLFVREISGRSFSLNPKYPVYTLFEYFVSGFSRTPHAITAANSLLICALVGLFIYRIGVHELYATFLFVSMYFYANSLNTARQYIAIAVVMNAFVFLLKKQWLPYLILTFIAIGFHQSAVVTFALLPIAYVKWNGHTLRIFAVVLAAVAFFYQFLLKGFLAVFPSYNVYFTVDSADGTTMAAALGKGNVLYYDLALLIIFGLLMAIIVRFELALTERDKVICVAYSVNVFLGLVFYNVMSIERVFTYFAIVGIVALPLLCERVAPIVFQRENGEILAFSLIFAVTLGVYTIQVMKNYDNITPYRTVLMRHHQVSALEVPNRQVIKM